MPRKPARPRLAPDARRDQILKSARELFAKRTYAAVSTTEIAEAAGVTWGLVAHYFGGKRGIYLAVVRNLVEFPSELVVVTEGTLEERVAVAIDRLLQTIERNPETWLTAIGGWGVGRDPELDEILDEQRENAVRGMVDLLGDDAPDVPVDDLLAVGRTVLATIEAATREWLQRDRLTRDQVDAIARRALLLWGDLAATAAQART